MLDKEIGLKLLGSQHESPESYFLVQFCMQFLFIHCTYVLFPEKMLRHFD
jgi:hypothetical protein